MQFTTKSRTYRLGWFDKFSNSLQKSASAPCDQTREVFGILRSLANDCFSISATEMHVSGEACSSCLEKLSKKGIKS